MAQYGIQWPAIAPAAPAEHPSRRRGNWLHGRQHRPFRSNPIGSTKRAEKSEMIYQQLITG